MASFLRLTLIIAAALAALIVAGALLAILVKAIVLAALIVGAIFLYNFTRAFARRVRDVNANG